MPLSAAPQVDVVITALLVTAGRPVVGAKRGIRFEAIKQLNRYRDDYGEKIINYYLGN